MTTPTREKRDRSNFSDRKSSIFPPSQLGVDFSFVTQGILPLVPSLDPPRPRCPLFPFRVQRASSYAKRPDRDRLSAAISQTKHHESSGDCQVRKRTLYVNTCSS